MDSVEDDLQELKDDVEDVGSPTRQRPYLHLVVTLVLLLILVLFAIGRTLP